MRKLRSGLRGGDRCKVWRREFRDLPGSIKEKGESWRAVLANSFKETAMKVSKIILLLLAFLAGIAGAFFYENVAPAEAKTEKTEDIDDPEGQHPYLSPAYNKPYPLTGAERLSLLFTNAYNCKAYLTENLIKISLYCILPENGLVVFVNTECQPSFAKYYERKSGKWSLSDRELRVAYTEAARRLEPLVRFFFPKGESGLTDDEFSIIFSIYGGPVGKWRNGKFVLEGEEE